LGPRDCQIDALVYELYGLTEEEIKIVEGERKTAFNSRSVNTQQSLLMQPDPIC